MSLESIGVKDLFRILCKERLTCLATLLRAAKTTGKKLGLYKVDDVRKFCVISSGELEKLRRRGGDARRIRAFHRKADAEITLLMSVVQKWKVKGEKWIVPGRFSLFTGGGVKSELV